MLKILLTAAVVFLISTVVFIQPSNAGNASFTENELDCLATTIYREARGETLRGQVLVAETVINRSHSKLYPNTICGVVKQKGYNSNGKLVCQFSWNCMRLPRIDKSVYIYSYYLAKFILNHQVKDISKGALFFFKDDELKYVRQMGIKLVTREGTHGFYVLKKVS